MRLPGKVLKKICGKTVFELTLERLRRVRNAKDVVLVTGPRELNGELILEAERLKVSYFSGSEENVLDRFYQAAVRFAPQVIVRVTGDCPLVDPELIDEGIQRFAKGDLDIIGNTRHHTFPHGFDFEVFSGEALERAWRKAHALFGTQDEFEKTFINPAQGIWNAPDSRKKDLVQETNLFSMRLTLDYPEDLEVIKRIYEALYPKHPAFSARELIQFLQDHPELFLLNQNRQVEAGM